MPPNTQYQIIVLLLGVVLSFAGIWYAYAEAETLASPAVPLIVMSVLLIVFYYYLERKGKANKEPR